MTSGVYKRTKKDLERIKKNLHYGDKLTIEEKEKLRIKMLGNKFALGNKLSQETKLKIGKANIGSKNNFWKDGRSKKIGYKLFLNGRRRALKLKAIGSHTIADWQTLKAQYNWTCPCCHKLEPEIKLSEDHIIPLSKGGSDNIENIQPLCRSCNSIKHTKIIKYV